MASEGKRHRVGLISDTHGLIRPEALAALAGVEMILHAGDVGSPEVLEALRSIAPVHAIRGNTDFGAYASLLPGQLYLQIGDVQVGVVHNLEGLRQRLPENSTRVVVFGHTHRAESYEQKGVLFVNPGSAGPRRGEILVTVAIITIEGAHMSLAIVTLDTDTLA